MHFLRDHITSLIVILAMPIVFLLPSYALADQTADSSSLFISSPNPKVTTESKFSETVEESYDSIPYAINYVDDSSLELGQESVLENGEEGKKKIITIITYYNDIEYSRSTEEEILAPARDRLIAKGSKVVYRQLPTEVGTLTYIRKFSNIWATSYDSTCPGCNTTTATGMKQGYGVVAVDPVVIPLGSRLYIPGYGIAVAGDVGGAIKGDRIDLGYDSLNGQWKAHNVDVYLLTD